MLHVEAGHRNNCQIILFCSDMTYFAIISSRVMLHTEAGHSNNCQIIVNCSDMTYFAIICSTKTISNKFGGIRGINHLRYK